MGKQQFDYSVSLQVKHPNLNPTAIATELGLEASHSWAAGQPRQTPNGTALSGVRSESYCKFEIASGTDGELASCLRNVLNHLKSRGEYLRSIRSSGGLLLFYIFWYPNGDTGEVFPTSLLQDMVDLGIELGINVYDDRPSD